MLLDFVTLAVLIAFVGGARDKPAALGFLLLCAFVVFALAAM